jgi:hypothetical protein
MRLSGAGEAVRAGMTQILARTLHAWHFIHTAPLQPIVRSPVGETTSCSQIAALRKSDRRVPFRSAEPHRDPISARICIRHAAIWTRPPPRPDVAAQRQGANRNCAGAPVVLIGASIDGRDGAAQIYRSKLPYRALRAGGVSAAISPISWCGPSHSASGRKLVASGLLTRSRRAN